MFTFSLLNSPTSHAGVGTKIKIGSDVKEGIKAFEEQHFEKAEKKFIDAQLKDPDNSVHYYNIGAAAYKTEDYDSALRNFQKALENEDPDLKHKTLFNIGNTKYRQGNLEESIKDFEKLTQNYPSDSLAKENLEFIKKKLEEQKKQEQQDKNKDKNNKKKQDNDNQNKKEDHQPEKKPEEKQNQKPDNEYDKQPGKQPENQSEKLKEMQKKDPKAKPSKQNMLNRLSDKPGKAMMPIFQKQKIEKDW